MKLSHIMSDRSLLLGKSFNQVEASSSARIHIGNKFPASLFLAEASCCAMPPVNQKPLAEQKHSAGKLKISQERLFGKCPTLGRSPWQNWGLLLDLMVERSLLLLGLSLEHNWVDALLLIKAKTLFGQMPSRWRCHTVGRTSWLGRSLLLIKAILGRNLCSARFVQWGKASC